MEGEFLTGTIKCWYISQNYGFVYQISDGGKDIFVHSSNVIVDSGRYPAIAPQTKVRLTYHLRDHFGKLSDTGIKVTDPYGSPLPGFASKTCAIMEIYTTLKEPWEVRLETRKETAEKNKTEGEKTK